MEIGSCYASLGIERLTAQQERYVQFRVQAMNPTAAARAAGFSNPAKAVAEMSEDESITTAISYLREVARAQAVAEGALTFSRDDATRMYMEAHAVAATSTEMRQAVDSLVKLHGVSAPEKKEVAVEVTHSSQLDDMTDDELLKLSGQEITLSPDDYHEVLDDDAV